MQRGRIVTQVVVMGTVFAAVGWVVVADFSASAAPEPALARAIHPEPMPMLVSFTWTGGHPSSDLWSGSGNWAGSLGYPDDANDDAVFNSRFYVILDANRTIDDLSVTDGELSSFDGDDSAITLTCDTVIISGDTSGDNGGVVVEGLAGIETN